MPLYIDIHEIPGATRDDLARAHLADEAIQAKYGVVYHKYWFNEATGKIFCCCSAPSPEAAASVHREAHGLLAEKIIEVDPDLADSFLGGCEVNPVGAALRPGTMSEECDSGLRTVLFTDIVDSTMLTQRLGDLAAMKLVESHDTVVREALSDNQGREVKHTGDGIMASFHDAASAVRCALCVQRALLRSASRIGPVPLRLRVGLAAGHPVEHNQDLFGTTVQLAARLCASAEPAQCLASSEVTELCAGQDIHFEYLGEYALKGFERPVRVHSVVGGA